MKDLTPRDHREAVALFRAEVIGALTRRELSHGELRREFAALSRERFRPPGATRTRTFSLPTLERWYYRYKAGGLPALEPRGRSDRGRARALTAEQRTLVLDIRREHPQASASVILRTLVSEGRIDDGALGVQTLRRLLREEGLDRASLVCASDPHVRLRWQASHPGALWQGDVCHGPTLRDPRSGGRSIPLRIHAILDDASRFIVALEAHSTERELDMLGLFADAVRRFGPPEALYVDNGSTYSGDALRLASERLGTTLIHSKPYQPQGRGKIERFFRTLRDNCLGFVAELSSLHDVNVRLLAFLDQHYHVAPHAGLMGRSPAAVFEAARPALRPLGEAALRDAFTQRTRRRVRRDSTLHVDGVAFELAQGFLAGRLVTVARCLIDPRASAWVEFEGRRFELAPVDPESNARRRRIPRPPENPSVPFDPATTHLDRALSRPNSSDPKETR